MNIINKLTSVQDLNNAFNFSVCENDFVFEFINNSSSQYKLEDFHKITGFELSYLDVDNDIYIDSDISNHDEICLKAELERKDLLDSNLNVYFNWKEMLENKVNLTTSPENFLILDESIIYPDNKPKTEANKKTINKIEHYQEIISLLKILLVNADHKNKLSNDVIEDVVFLHKSRLEIPISYSEALLDEKLDGISIVKALFDEKSHKEQKKSIFKEVLHGFLINVPKKERLEHLIVYFGEFSKRYNENYQLFVSEFSFDEVRKEYEEKKRDYFTALNDVFSSVQTKMLGIPVSLALGALKMSAIIDDVTFWTNALLAFSIIIYSIMMFMLIKNQKHTLSAIKTEYDSQMTRLKHQYVEQYEEIKNIQIDLDKRHDFQKSCLNWFYVLTFSLFILIVSRFTWNLPWKTILGI